MNDGEKPTGISIILVLTQEQKLVCKWKMQGWGYTFPDSMWACETQCSGSYSLNNMIFYNLICIQLLKYYKYFRKYRTNYEPIKGIY